MSTLYERCVWCCGSGENRAARRGRRVECAVCDGAGYVPAVVRSAAKRRRRLVLMPALVVVWLLSLMAGTAAVWRWL